MKKEYGLFLGILFLSLTVSLCQAASSMKAVDFDVKATMDKFTQEHMGGADFLKKAEGILVFPSIIKAGVWLGGEYGEGALIVRGKTIDYYSTVSASFGLQLGVQKKSLIICFMTKDALEQFRNSGNWEIGADASVALVKIGAGFKGDTETIKEPVIGFVFGQKGLMYNLTLEGTKVSRIDKQQMLP